MHTHKQQYIHTHTSNNTTGQKMKVLEEAVNEKSFTLWDLLSRTFEKDSNIFQNLMAAGWVSLYGLMYLCVTSAYVPHDKM
jgi:hypothetical protein